MNKLIDNLYDDNKTINTKSEKLLFGNIKFLKNGTMLRNIPREDYTIKDTFIKYAHYNSKENESWPNNDFNNYNKIFNSCEGFISIIAFELDDEENIYILDEEIPIALLCYINLIQREKIWKIILFIITIV